MRVKNLHALFFFFGFDLGFGGGAGDASDDSEEVSSSKSPETPVGGPTDTGIGAATRLEGLLAFVGVVLAPLVTAGVAEDTGRLVSSVAEAPREYNPNTGRLT